MTYISGGTSRSLAVLMSYQSWQSWHAAVARTMRHTAHKRAHRVLVVAAVRELTSKVFIRPQANPPAEVVRTALALGIIPATRVVAVAIIADVTREGSGLAAPTRHRQESASLEVPTCTLI